MGKRFIAINFLVVSSFLATPAPATMPNKGVDLNGGSVAIAQAATQDDSYNWTKKVWVTAYSSTQEETDDTPFITASMTEVRDGIIAANFLPFGTRVMIPKLFGKKIFTVEDRMHQRKTNFIDIWMPTKNDAIQFGITYAEIVVIHEG